MFDLNAATSQIPIKTLTLTDDPEDLAVAAKAVNGQVGVAVSYGDGLADVFSYANGAFSTPVNVVVDSAGFSASGSRRFRPTEPCWPSGTMTASSISGTSLSRADRDRHRASPSGTAGIADAVYAVDFSPNGSYLAAGGGSADDSDSNAAVFNVAARSQRARANCSHNVTAIAFSPIGNAVGGGEGDCGRVFMCTN